MANSALKFTELVMEAWWPCCCIPGLWRLGSGNSDSKPSNDLCSVMRVLLDTAWTVYIMWLHSLPMSFTLSLNSLRGFRRSPWSGGAHCAV